MNRTWVAIAASTVAVLVLLALIYSSRPLGSEEFQAHYTRLNAVDTSVATYTGLVEQLRLARREGAGAGSTVSILRSRLEQNGQQVAGSARDILGAAPTYSRYVSALSGIVESASDAESRLGDYQRAQTVVREDGPAVVQRLRDSEGGPDPQRFYALILRVIEYGRTGNGNPDVLADQIEQVAFADGSMPTWLLDLTNAMNTIVVARAPLDASVAAVEQSGFSQAANALASEFRLRHEAKVTERNNSRVLVSLYSLTLFGGLGYLGYRLNRSYREINDVNEQLQQSNVDLERRVVQRTQDVQKAYTDLQQSQVQLVQAEKMSSLGQLVAGISHEINTPLLYLQSNATINKETLSRIEDFVELCHKRLLPTRRSGEAAQEARKRFVDGLKGLQRALVEGEIRDELKEVMLLTDDNLEGLEELTQLAQGLKDFSRLDRAPIDSYDINAGVDRTLVIAKNMLKTRVQVNTEMGDVPRITCAPSQINQVLLNLITNASQAIEGTGTITIQTGTDDNDNVYARVIDSGTGIPDDIMQKIRDPFFTTKEVGSGTGLGLSIVEEILGKHGGTLEIESTEGEGSTFSIYLPISRAQEVLEASFAEADSAKDSANNVASIEAPSHEERRDVEATSGQLAVAPD
ncbi:MAG: sensor histidine kinase [Gammaproteobacteria bacterium]